MPTTPGSFHTDNPTPGAEAAPRPFTAFYRTDAVRHHVEESSDCAKLPLSLRTASAPWAYAVEWRRLGHVPVTPLLATVTLHVLEGTVAVGILKPAGDTFADEAVITAASQPTSARLVVVCAEDFGSLIVRNASSAGSSRAVVMDVTFAPLDEPHERVLPPMLSCPVPVAGWARCYGTGDLTPLERLRAARFERLEHAMVLRWSDGLAFQVHPGNQLSRAIFLSATYEPNTLCVLRTLLRPGDTFIDVGSNAGIVSLAAAQWVGPTGRVHAFEPSTREYERLLDTIARNRLDWVSPHRVALGARRETGVLHVASDLHAGLNTFADRFAYGGISLQTTEDVSVRTLDDLVGEAAIGRVSAIKIDVEGMELDVLQGARRLLANHRPALVIEVIDRALEACGGSVAALEDLLVAQGYTLWSIGEAAELRRLTSLREPASENIVALHQSNV